jgi:carboxypeptidase PM20D1
MFDNVGRHSSFAYRMIFANLWCFGGVLNGICKKSGGELNALVRTTVAFTQASGSKAPNVIPPTSSLVANLRLNPEDTVEGAAAYIRGVVGDKDVQITVGEGATNPSPISERAACWNKVAEAVAETWNGCIVSRI